MTPSLLNVTEDSKFTFLQILTSSDGCTAECTGESYLPVLAGCCDTHKPTRLTSCTSEIYCFTIFSFIFRKLPVFYHERKLSAKFFFTARYALS